MNHNKILGVNDGAPAEEIKKAYRKAAKEHHPDHSDSPEAAEAFARIKQAHDELLKQAQATERVNTIQAATAAAARATPQAAYAKTDDDTVRGASAMSPEEISHHQDLDRKAASAVHRFSFKPTKEDPEVTKHRNKIRTNNDRIVGKY